MHCRGPKILLATLVLVSCVDLRAQAQLKGEYLPGFTGLQNGSLPPPGLSMPVSASLYPTDEIKNSSGNDVPVRRHVTQSFVNVGLGAVTNIKVLGANYGASTTPISLVKSRIESASTEVPGSWEFSDIYVQPLWLGWNRQRADYSLGWGFFAPTGKWELGGSDNGGLGMWSNDFQAGSTVYLDPARSLSTSALTTYEIHSKKRDVNLRVGDILTIEGGTGKAFNTEVEGTPDPLTVNVGLAYYAQFKVTADSGGGPLADAVLAGGKDRVYGLGVEGSIFLPRQNLFLDLRVVPEFGARNRTEGVTLVFTGDWSFKSFAKE